MNAPPLSDATQVTFGPRASPRPVRAAAARGVVARSLARRLLTRETLDGLRAVAGDSLLVVLGDEAALPWVDGIEYLGSAGRGSLYLPVLLEPSVPESLYEAALGARVPELEPPLALLVAERTMCVSLACASPIARSRLESWLERGLERGLGGA